MASPLPTRKTTVDLTGGVRLSRIRRDPPAKPVKLLTRYEQRRREAWAMAIGITGLSLALFVIMVVLGRGPSWTPADMTIVIRQA